MWEEGEMDDRQQGFQVGIKLKTFFTCRLRPLDYQDTPEGLIFDDQCNLLSFISIF